MILVPSLEKIDFEINLVDIFKSDQEAVNKNLYSYLEKLESQRMQKKNLTIWWSGKKIESGATAQSNRPEKSVIAGTSDGNRFSGTYFGTALKLQEENRSKAFLKCIFTIEHADLIMDQRSL